MNQSKISVRYAKAMFMLAQEKKILSDIYADFVLIREALKGTPEFNDIISSPVISPQDKKNTLTNVFGKIVNEQTIKFLIMLVDKDREEYLNDIARNFETQYRRARNIKQVNVITNCPMTEDASKRIIQVVSEAHNCGCEINKITNPEMIGGIIIRIDNRQLDLSVKTQLLEIKKKLRSKSYQKQI